MPSVAQIPSSLTHGIGIDAHAGLLVDHLERRPIESHQRFVGGTVVRTHMIVADAHAKISDGRSEDLTGNDLQHGVVRGGIIGADVLVLQDLEVGVRDTGVRLAAHPFEGKYPSVLGVLGI